MGRVDDMSKVLMNYDAYIMPSLFEGFGIAPMEAIATGMPALLSDLPVFKELNGNVPIYFDPKDSASICRSIEDCICNWDEVKAKAEEGKTIIFEKASREKYVQSLRSIYKDVQGLTT